MHTSNRPRGAVLTTCMLLFALVAIGCSHSGQTTNADSGEDDVSGVRALTLAGGGIRVLIRGAGANGVVIIKTKRF